MKKIFLQALHLSLFLAPSLALDGTAQAHNHAEQAWAGFCAAPQKFRSVPLAASNWQLTDFSGVQVINFGDSMLDAWAQAQAEERPLLYSKGIFFTAEIFGNFQVFASVSAGFEREALPTQFSAQVLPQLTDRWAAFSASLLSSRRTAFSEKLAVLPFVGYDYMQHGQTAKHSLLAGASLEWLPASSLLLSASAFVSPSMVFALDEIFRSYSGLKVAAALSFWGLRLEVFCSSKTEATAYRQGTQMTFFTEVGAGLKFDL